jgi:uncharacterized caspase-like protein
MSRRLALIIGNSEYQDAKLAHLVTPGEDANDLAEVLRSPDIGGFDEVVTLINQSAPVIRRAVARLFSDKKPDDLLLLYFSGHGVRDDRGLLYLAVQDTEHDLLNATAIAAMFITEEMDRSRSRRQVLILDCCHSGAFAQGAKGVPGLSVGTGTAFEGTGYGRVVLTATDSTQYAWEGDRLIGEAENSVFTHHLVQGLHSGLADTDADGRITLDELYNYVYEQVVQETPRQTPRKFAYNQQGDVIIAKNPKPVVRPAELTAELRQAVESSLAGVREGAVRELERLLRSGDRALGVAALEALRLLEQDDSRRVSSAASAVLAAHAKRLAEAETQARETAAREQAAREQAEKERLAGQKLAAERRAAHEQAEAQRAARELADQERLEREKAEADRAALALAEQENQKRGQAERERLEREKAEADRAARAKVDAERQAAADRSARALAEQESQKRAQAERERLEREKAEADRAARAKVDAERQATADRAARALAQQQSQERAQAERERQARQPGAEARPKTSAAPQPVQSASVVPNTGAGGGAVTSGVNWLAVFGAAIGFGLAYLTGNSLAPLIVGDGKFPILGYVADAANWIAAYAVAGLAVGLVLRQTQPSYRWVYVPALTLACGLCGALAWVPNALATLTGNWTVGRWLGVTLGSLLSGGSVGLTLWRARSFVAPWQPFVIVAGWTFSAVVALLVNIVTYWNANQFWIGMIDGAVGSAVMFWVLRQDRAGATSRKASP